MATTQAAGARKAQIRWTGFGIEMAGDVDRDGLINVHPAFTDDNGKQVKSDLTKEPFVFWINDDDDDETAEVRTDDTVDTPGSNDTFLGWFGEFDHENDFIDGTRDLIDFVAVGVQLHTFISTAPNAESFTYTLKHPDSAVNIVYTDMDFDNADQYLKELDVNNIAAVFGNWQNATTLANVPVHEVSSEGLNLPSEFISLIKNNQNKGIFLAEFNKPTTEPLELVVTDTENNEVLRAKMHLRAVEVEELYLQVDLREPPSETGSSLWNNTAPNVAERMSQWTQDRQTLLGKASDMVDSGRNMIFVHGCCNNKDQARAFQSETYKRLYHTGSNVVFTGIHWKGDEGANYWGAVENAFNTADDLAAVVNAIDGQKALAAHSLGNVVVGSAIQDFYMQVNQYFMLNPALAIEAYDAGQLAARQMYHPDWNTYYYDIANPNFDSAEGRRLWSTEWHTLFPQIDHRSKLTWRNRFGDVPGRTRVTQFYSTGEEVLMPATEGIPNSLEPIAGDYWLVGLFFDGNIASGSNAWNIQEKAKGTNSLPAVLAGNSAAGWGFNELCEQDDPLNCRSTETLTKDEAQQHYYSLGDAELAANPFFKPFNNPALHDEQGGSAAAITGHPHILGYEIPALSFAAGGTRMRDRQGVALDKTDMNLIMQGWPQERIDEFQEVRWFHSDFKDVAYRYTYPVFDDMVTRGNLK